MVRKADIRRVQMCRLLVPEGSSSALPLKAGVTVKRPRGGCWPWSSSRKVAAFTFKEEHSNLKDEAPPSTAISAAAPLDLEHLFGCYNKGATVKVSAVVGGRKLVARDTVDHFVDQLVALGHNDIVTLWLSEATPRTGSVGNDVSPRGPLGDDTLLLHGHADGHALNTAGGHKEHPPSEQLHKEVQEAGKTSLESTTQPGNVVVEAEADNDIPKTADAAATQHGNVVVEAELDNDIPKTADAAATQHGNVVVEAEPDNDIPKTADAAATQPGNVVVEAEPDNDIPKTAGEDKAHGDAKEAGKAGPAPPCIGATFTSAPSKPQCKRRPRRRQRQANPSQDPTNAPVNTLAPSPVVSPRLEREKEQRARERKVKQAKTKAERRQQRRQGVQQAEGAEGHDGAEDRPEQVWGTVPVTPPRATRRAGRRQRRRQERCTNEEDSAEEAEAPQGQQTSRCFPVGPEQRRLLQRCRSALERRHDVRIVPPAKGAAAGHGTVTGAAEDVAEALAELKKALHPATPQAQPHANKIKVKVAKNKVASIVGEEKDPSREIHNDNNSLLQHMDCPSITLTCTDNTLLLEARLAGVKVTFLVDSGANVSVLPYHVARDAGLLARLNPLDACHKEPVAEYSPTIHGTLQEPLHCAGGQTLRPLLVVMSPAEPLLGLEVLRAHRCVLTCSRLRPALRLREPHPPWPADLLPHLIHVHATVMGRPMLALVDTGATDCFMSPRRACELQLEVRRVPGEEAVVKTTTGMVPTPGNTGSVTLTFLGLSTTTSFCVIDTDEDIVIGLNVLLDEGVRIYCDP